MSLLVKSIDAYKASHRTAFRSRQGAIDYARLYEKSNRLAELMCCEFPNGMPVVLMGHKEPEMLVGMLACAKSGRPFVPVDENIPEPRLTSIKEQLGGCAVLRASAIGELCTKKSFHKLHGWDGLLRRDVVNDDCFYIMFTSGSTGEPKGVRISIGNVEDFVAWMLDVHRFDREVFINQAPFHFDLSVLELWCGLSSESTIHAITKQQVKHPPSMFNWLRMSDATTWVSTPSFARMCLSSPTFNADAIPTLKRFLFCGETLPWKTARELTERWPGAEVHNMYGPTEATCAVTNVRLTDYMFDTYDPLPCGWVKPGTSLLIEDGEVVILGDGVGLGYVGEDQGGFTVIDEQRAYYTGDVGFVNSDGLLFVHGREDSQVKVGGQRIDLADVDTNLRRCWGVLDAASAVSKKGHLVAAVVLEPGMTQTHVADELAYYVPDYMIPSIKVVTALPMTPNGKVDRSRI